MKRLFQSLKELFDMNQEQSHYKGSNFHRVGAILILLAILGASCYALAELIIEAIW